MEKDGSMDLEIDKKVGRFELHFGGKVAKIADGLDAWLTGRGIKCLTRGGSSGIS